MTQALMKPEDVARRYGIEVNTLYQWKYRGEGPKAIKLGGRLRYRSEDVEQWLEEQAATS